MVGKEAMKTPTFLNLEMDVGLEMLCFIWLTGVSPEPLWGGDRSKPGFVATVL